MPFLRKAELMPVKGIDRSIPSTYLPEGNAFPENMTYLQGEMKKRDGTTTFGDVAIGGHKILHLATFETSTGIVYFIRHTRYNIEKYNTGSSAYDDITGSDMSGAETDYFSSAVITEDDVYVFTNYTDNIRKWTAAGNTQLLGGSPPKARYIEYMTPYLLLANVEESGTALPTKVRWSDTGDIENWTTGNSGSQLLTHEPSAIRGMRQMGDFIFFYKEKSIYRGRQVSSSDVFSIEPFDFDKGLYSPRTVVNAEGVHFYMGLNDFYMNNGIRVNPIGAAVREFIFNRLNREKNTSCHALYNSPLKEIWFFITISGQSLPTEIWKYRYDLGFWYKDSIQNVITAAEYKIVTSLTWDTAPGVWNGQTVSWDDMSGQADAPAIIIGRDDGYTYRFNPRTHNDKGSPFTGKLETRDFTGLPPAGNGKIGIEEDQRWLQLDLWAKGSSVKIYYSTDFGESWTYIKEFTLTAAVAKYTCYFDIISPTIRFKFENEKSEGNFTIRSFVPYYLGSGDIPNP